MPLSFVQTIGTVSRINSSGTTSVITVPAGGVAAGDVIRVSGTVSTNPISGYSCTDSKGNTYALDAIAARGISPILASYQFTAIAATALVSGDTITVTTPAVSYADAAANQYTGFSGSYALDATASSIGSSTAPNSGATATTADPNELVTGTVGFNNATLGTTAETYTDGQSMTARTNAQGGTASATRVGVFPQDKIVAATAAYIESGTLGHTDSWVAICATYRSTVNTTPTVSDAGTAAEAASLGAAIPATDAGAGAETTATGIAKAGSDAAVFAESSSAVVSGLSKAVSDSAVFAESSSVLTEPPNVSGVYAYRWIALS